MSAPAWILLFVVVVSVGALTAMLIGLGREGMRLGRAGMDLADAVLPVVDEISAEADRAAAHGTELSERLASLRS